MTRLNELKAAVRQELAWSSIHAEREELNLDAFQANQARTKLEQAREAVRQRIPETYIWLLAPGQPDPAGPVEWSEARLSGPEALAIRAARKLRNDEALLTRMAGTILAYHLNRIPLWRGDHVGVRQLADDFAQYLYLPRPRNTDVLLQAIEEGAALLTWRQDSFAYAEGWDETLRRYPGLVGGTRPIVALDSHSVVVKPAIAAAQQETDDRARSTGATGATATTYAADTPGDATIREPVPGSLAPGSASGGVPPARRVIRRFHGSVSLSPTRLSRDADEVAREVVAHLTGLLGANVRVTLQVEADLPDGIPDDTVRTLVENCRTLRFISPSFETE
jgi:hypothetical protein